MFGFYIYFLEFYISDLVYYLVSNSNLILKQTIAFIAVTVFVPIVAIILFAVIKARIKFVNGEETMDTDAFSISKRVRNKTDNSVNNDDVDEIK